MLLEHEFLQITPARAEQLRRDALAVPYDEVHAPPDRLIISRFRRFCEETLDSGLCLVHFGI